MLLVVVVVIEITAMTVMTMTRRVPQSYEGRDLRAIFDHVIRFNNPLLDDYPRTLLPFYLECGEVTYEVVPIHVVFGGKACS